MDKMILGENPVLIIAAVVIVLLVLIVIFKMIFKKKEDTSHFQNIRCTGCGWEGRVSRYAGRCPKCNQAIGDRSAQPRE